MCCLTSALSIHFQLTPWWLNIAYLEARTPLPIVTSPGITLESFPIKGESGQLEYAAKVIHVALRFYAQVKRLVD